MCVYVCICLFNTKLIVHEGNERASTCIQNKLHHQIIVENISANTCTYRRFFWELHMSEYLHPICMKSIII